ncbi:MAG TPA: helix-turn-helix domain-containing protein [Solirubrobacteraceae bacterium]|jgi:AcrR family transcriptional regulator
MAASRRLSRQARRDQLVSAAIPLVARRGPADLSLDEVAERAGVTRNLLYHYFPRGRSDLVSAVLDDAERQLVGQSQELDQAISRILDHALAATHAWRIHRMAGALPAFTRRAEATAAAVDALRDFTGAEATPLSDLALHGYVAYAEAVLDGARTAGIPRSDVRGLLARTLRAVVAAG